MAAGIWDIIREATRSSHCRLDAALAKLDLTFSVNYEGFLRSQAEALFPLETALEAKGIETGNWRVDARGSQKFQVFFVSAPDGLCYYFHEAL